MYGSKARKRIAGGFEANIQGVKRVLCFFGCSVSVSVVTGRGRLESMRTLLMVKVRLWHVTPRQSPVCVMAVLTLEVMVWLGVHRRLFFARRHCHSSSWEEHDGVLDSGRTFPSHVDMKVAASLQPSAVFSLLRTRWSLWVVGLCWRRRQLRKRKTSSPKSVVDSSHSPPRTVVARDTQRVRQLVLAETCIAMTLSWSRTAFCRGRTPSWL